MKTLMKYALALAIGTMMATGPAMADKPAWAGADKGGKHERADKRDDRHDDRRAEQRNDNRKPKRDNDRYSSGGSRHFEDRQHVVVREYYVEHYSSGRCPPGLAKKHNGCMPPGQAKKWQVGRPLAREVIYYEVPQPLVVQIGLPPSGHRYVRVAGDILLIAIGTGMVVDAIQDLGRM
ncbi:MAG: RcnB family protein [Rhodocyclaceae bacterium]